MQVEEDGGAYHGAGCVSVTLGVVVMTMVSFWTSRLSSSTALVCFV